MEPVTHMLTGAVLARAGVHRRTASAVAAMVVAAEFPDIDTVWSLGGPVMGLEHHRGITHTFLGVPVEAALITAAFWLWQRLRKPPKHAPPVALHVGWLYAGTLLALLSHILLDWTNNYGVRPFFPFDAHWYAGSFVFIVEPVLLAILAAALVLPALFGLINAEVGARKKGFVSAGWSWIALVLVAALYALRSHERQTAINMIFEDHPEAQRIFANPQPLNPYQWSVIAEGPNYYSIFSVDAQRGPDPHSVVFYKPEEDTVIAAAKSSYLGRVYLDWSMFPVMEATPDVTDPRHPLMRVSFSDARYLYDTALLDAAKNPPLSGSVLLDMQAPPGQQVVEMVLDGRVQR